MMRFTILPIITSSESRVNRVLYDKQVCVREGYERRLQIHRYYICISIH